MLFFHRASSVHKQIGLGAQIRYRQLQAHANWTAKETRVTVESRHSPRRLWSRQLRRLDAHSHASPPHCSRQIAGLWATPQGVLERATHGQPEFLICVRPSAFRHPRCHWASLYAVTNQENSLNPQSHRTVHDAHCCAQTCPRPPGFAGWYSGSPQPWQIAESLMQRSRIHLQHHPHHPPHRGSRWSSYPTRTQPHPSSGVDVGAASPCGSSR
mmetsp:Transcript_117736/g.293576  ORF Transcript_117736/g.293576 Transcript_117736/m.293576 type:complete len:213 (-) Transcript_117736:15-653(-)